ncbi:MAG TPA: universal stress protein [Bacillota bacterium]|jgi:nucleotide-binding universal stress UspA family protein|nr:universal stress protein [Peptococcaceae bacterium MAG4]NLW38229.1 universal stress protein [Peptococcaceae bacterium]HPZ42365.1 universal stress protein [Bacillota bacterium]HQD75031.1 universal stress protein [Bacillota bacterium]HUM57588.1 universal stress protein [Bacillota bacterium]
MYKKILIPVDGSSKSLIAARHGAELASRFGSSVTLIHIIPVLPLDLRGMVINKFRAEAKELLKKVARDLERFNISIDLKVKSGKTADCICRVARKYQYDLIVIGSRGLSEVKGYLLGSVSNAVTMHAPCPVLIIR